MPETLPRELTNRPEGRPFPWHCPRCRQKCVWPVVLPYRTAIRHDGALHEVELPALNVPRCEACGELVMDDWASEQIYRAFRASRRLLDPALIRSNRLALGLSCAELAERLVVAAEQVEAWEEGRSLQPGTADTLLRLFFALPQVRTALDNGVTPGLGTAVDSPPLPTA